MGKRQDYGYESAGEVFPEEEVQLQLSCKGMENVLSKKIKSFTCSLGDNWKAKKQNKKRVNDSGKVLGLLTAAERHSFLAGNRQG